MAFLKSFVCLIILVVFTSASLALRQYDESCVEDAESEDSCDSTQFLKCYLSFGQINGICKCIGQGEDEMYWDQEDLICRSSAGHLCDQGQTCAHHAKCIQNQCECEVGYNQTTNEGKYCLASWGTSCDHELSFPSKHCDTERDLHCNKTNNICQCVEDWIWNGENCFRIPQNPGIGETCLIGDTCPKNSSCDGGVCTCHASYSRTKDGRHCKLSIDSICEQNSAEIEFQCNEDEFLTCSPDGQCTCDGDMVYKNWGYTYPKLNKCRALVGGVCDLLDLENDMYFFRTCVYGAFCSQESDTRKGKCHENDGTSMVNANFLFLVTALAVVGLSYQKS